MPASAGRLKLEGTDVWVSGTVEGLPAGTALAVTVDGRVAATTRIDGSGTFGRRSSRRVPWMSSR